MTLKQAQAVLESLKELSVDVEYFSWGPSYSYAQKRQKDAIKIMNRVVKELKHQQKAQELGCGMLDSLTECPECHEMTLVSKMAGGYECKNPHCDYGEIAF